MTGSGEFKRNKAYKSHILEKKSPKRKRNLRKAAIASHADTAHQEMPSLRISD
jgi:large subunit ribosomal protein L35